MPFFLLEYGEGLVNASMAVRIIAVVVILVVVVAGTYAGLTFPRAVVDFPVSFTIGVDREQREFEVPVLHSQIQVEVAVSNGSSLWRAFITNNAGAELWSHSAAQGEQQTYHSDWIPLSTGRYNFTFATLGAGSLDANVKVISKGGFW